MWASAPSRPFDARAPGNHRLRRRAAVSCRRPAVRQTASGRILRFMLTGGAAGLVQLGLLQAGTELGWDPMLANALAFGLAAQINFALSQWFTWRDRHVKWAIWCPLAGRWLRFHASICGTALLNLVVFALCGALLPTLLAALLGIAAAAMANFVLGDRFVFRPSTARAVPPRTSRP